MNAAGIDQAVAAHDTAALVDWLLQAFGYQGVSDAVADRYMREHGRLSMHDVRQALAQAPSCPRLQSHAMFQGCGYAKAARTCAEPNHLPSCPLPRHDLRNGRLNQIGYGLTLFARDVCEGDVVAWIDDRLTTVSQSDDGDRSLLMRAALIEPLSRIHGVSFKVLSMAMADLLLGADPSRPLWVHAGAGMVAIDTLVHNWLSRTGILRTWEVEHAYGPLCYAPGRCADLITTAAQAIDAREFCPDGPATFPRLIQHAIWRFCAEGGLGVCNGNRIDDRFPCSETTCPVGTICERVTLQPGRAKTAVASSPGEVSA